MENFEQAPQDYNLTSTQIGAIGESVVATQLILASGGRLAPFKPFADDDGIDLLMYDKLTKRALPIQVKSRTKFDDEKAQTVQFDVQLSTFTEKGGSHLLAILLDGTELICSWLIPMNELQERARTGKSKLSIVPSAKLTSKGRYRPYRCGSFAEIADNLINVLSA